jgi:hypothetical protein
VKKLMIAVALTLAVIGGTIAVTAVTSTHVVAGKGGGSDGG